MKSEKTQEDWSVGIDYLKEARKGLDSILSRKSKTPTLLLHEDRMKVFYAAKIIDEFLKTFDKQKEKRGGE